MSLSQTDPTPKGVASFFEVSTGRYSDCWVRVKSAVTQVIDSWNGKRWKKSVPCAVLTLVEHESGEEHTELIFGGSEETWSCDGKNFIPKKGAAKLSQSQPAGKLLLAINTSGFVWDVNSILTKGWAQLNGHLFWLEREDQVDRKTGKPVVDDGGYTKSDILFTKWGGNGAQPVESQSPAGQAAQTQAPAASGNDEAAITAAVLALVANGPVPLVNITSAFAQQPPCDLQSCFTMVGGPWMKDVARPWAVDAMGVVTKR